MWIGNWEANKITDKRDAISPFDCPCTPTPSSTWNQITGCRACIYNKNAASSIYF